ncbi:hypothetical protein [Streptomyces platensis]
MAAHLEARRAVNSNAASPSTIRDITIRNATPSEGEMQPSADNA